MNSKIIQIDKREDIPSIIKDGSIGCEVGIFEGEYSQILADSGKFSKLYLVDLFKGVASSGDKSGRNIKTYPDASILYEHNVNRFKQYDFIEIIKSTSIDFLNRMTNMLDFVYIDTVHTYEYTMLELNSAYNAIKSGGIISGHDYNEQQYSGLVRAVKEFCDRHNLNFYLTNQDTLESFVIVKT